MFDFSQSPANSPFGGVERGAYADDIRAAIGIIRDAGFSADRFCAGRNEYEFHADFGNVTLRLPVMSGSPDKVIQCVKTLLRRSERPENQNAQATAAGDLVLDAGVPELAAHLGIEPRTFGEAVTLVRTRPRAMIATDGPLAPSDCAVHLGELKLTRQGGRIVCHLRRDTFRVSGDTITIRRPITLPDTVIGSLPGRRLGTVVSGLPAWDDAVVRKAWSAANHLNLQVDARPLAV